MKKIIFILGLILSACMMPNESLAQQTEEEATDSLKALLAKAEAGDATAQNIVGEWYYKGKHVPQDYKVAAQWWAKSAKQGNIYAIGNLAICYQMGHGVEKDSLRAFGLYTASIKKGNQKLFDNSKKLADNGIVFNSVYTAYCYQNAIGCTKDKTSAATYYTKAADNNSVDAQRELALLYLNDGKPNEAVKWFKKGADNGSLPCIFYYGKLLHEGKGVVQDKQQGFDYLLKAANADFPMGQYEVALAYFEGNGVTQSDQTAIEWLTKAANNEVSKAQYLLAQHYVSGVGVDIDFDQAIEWFAAAMPKGHATAFKKSFEKSDSANYYGTPFHSYLKGMKYYSEKDYDNALEQFKAVEKEGFKEGKTMQGAILANTNYEKYNLKKGVKALNDAAATSSMAQYILGGLYEAGKGVDKDMNQALYYLKLSAGAGYASALCYLGDMYFEGRGVEQSYHEAVDCYLKAKALLPANSARRLASCYENGWGGLSADKDKAEELMKKKTGTKNELFNLIPMN